MTEIYSDTLAEYANGCILGGVILRDPERTPVLSQDGLVLSKKVQREIRRLAGQLGHISDALERRWKKRLE